MTELSANLISYMQKYYCNNLMERYKIDESMDIETALSQVADVRKCIKKGNVPDIDRAARIIIDDFRSLKLGNISLERPEEIKG